MAHNLQSLLPSLMKRHLSIAKQIDKISPHLKNYLFSGQGSFPLLPEPGILTHDLDVARLIRAYAEIVCEKQGNHTLYVPPSSLYDIVRDAYRRKPGDPAPSSTFPIELDNSIDVRIDAAYNNLFDLLTITNVNNELVESGYLNVEKMGNYIHKNITERSEVRPGSLLVEHPATVYSGSGLVYVHDIAKNIQEIHGNEEWRIRGFFCNYPTHKTVNDYWDVGKNTAFAQLPVFWGGNGNDLYILHRFPNIEAAQVIGDPETDGDCLCVGAVIDSVNEMLENGSASPEDFKVIRGSWESPLVETSDGIEWPESVEWRVAAGRGALDIAMHPPILPPVGMFPNDVTEEASGDFNFVQTYHISKTWSHVVYALAVNNVSVLYESIEADKRPQFPDPYEFPDEFIYAVQDYSLIDSRYKKAFELLHWKYNHSGLAHYLKERRPHQIANFVDNYLAASEAATQQTAESEEPVYKEREPMKFK